MSVCLSVAAPGTHNSDRHHHVESIHFQTQSSATLHPALAIVQTSNREYYILKDNGMQVGSEEEGVAAVWMQLLSCTNSGESL